MVRETTNLRAKTVEEAVSHAKETVPSLRDQGHHSSADRLENNIQQARQIVQETDNSGQFVSIPCDVASNLAADSRGKVPEIGQHLRKINHWKS